jgi:hypothetical protein
MAATGKAANRVARLGADTVEIWSDRESKSRVRLVALILFVLAVIVSVAAYQIGDLGKLQERLSFREGQAALQAITDPKEVDEALKQYPSNKYLKLVALAASVVAETDAASEKLLNDIVPPSVSGDINPNAASRSDLEALSRDLKTAETSVTTAMPRYVALLKAEREKMENGARSLHPEKDVLNRFMDGVDKWQAETADLVSKTLSARGDYYRTYGKCVTLLLGEFAYYNVANGRIIFTAQSSADRYNAAASAVTPAVKRITELKEERKALMQSQLKRWLHIADTSH